jgi:hypothetical protein
MGAEEIVTPITVSERCWKMSINPSQCIGASGVWERLSSRKDRNMQRVCVKK